MPKITTIIFDLGGVLVEEKGTKIFQEICSHFHIDKKRFYQILPKWKHNASIGTITLETMYRKILKELNKNPSLAVSVIQMHLRLYKKYSTQRDKKVLHLIRLLKKTYTVIALTNTEIEIADINKKNGLFKPFHTTYTSVDLHMRKPDIEIYEFVLKDLKIQPSEAVLIDDKQENLESAKTIGMYGILYKDFCRLTKNLKKLGVLH